MIPEGKYVAKAVQWDFGYTRGKEGEAPKEQIAVQFEVAEGEYQGHTLTWYGFFTEKAQQRTIESLRYAGWSSDDIMEMSGMGDVLCQVVVEHETQTEGKGAGEVRARIRWVNQLGGPIKLERPMDMAQKRMFAARVKLLAKLAPPMKGGVAVTDRAKTEPNHAGKTDDPF